MKYEQPMIECVANAWSAINLITQKTDSYLEFNEPVPNNDGAAYELDE